MKGILKKCITALLVTTMIASSFTMSAYATEEVHDVHDVEVVEEEVKDATMELAMAGVPVKEAGAGYTGTTILDAYDIDANTGGYNMQIAFSTGRLAGQLKK